jgi:hypothetical protein
LDNLLIEQTRSRAQPHGRQRLGGYQERSHPSMPCPLMQVLPSVYRCPGGDTEVATCAPQKGARTGKRPSHCRARCTGARGDRRLCPVRTLVRKSEKDCPYAATEELAKMGTTEPVS